MQSKTRLLIAIVLGIVVLLGAKIVLPTKSFNTGSQVESTSKSVKRANYSNDNLKIAFSYPQEYSVETAKNYCDAGICTFPEVISLKLIGSVIPKNMAIYKYAKNDPPMVSVNKLLKLKVGQSILEPSRSYVRLEDSKVDGEKSYNYYSFLGSSFISSVPYLVHVIPHGDYFYYILYSDPGIDESNPSLIPEVVQSIKFFK
jgi:hypothetical protein